MREDRLASLHRLLAERILILDGAMGTMIQAHGLGSHDYHGERFHAHGCDQKGNNDLLTLTQPAIIAGIHTSYLEAGADIIETNTFNSTRIAMADYGMQEQVRELNLSGARLAREAADAFTRQTPDKPRFVAGVLGPTNRTASISPDVNDPGARNVTFDELVEAYAEAVAALLDGGVDLIMVETIFDTLNAKAALFAVDECLRAQRRAAADHDFGHHHRPLRPHLIGPDRRCVLEFGVARQAVLDRPELRARSQGSAPAHRRACGHRRHAIRRCIRMQGCPMKWASTTSRPSTWRALLREFAQAGFLNIVGGCCGTTPAHIRAIAAAVQRCAPRPVPQIEKKLRLSGLEPLNIGDDSLFVNVGERTNVTGSKAFARLILSGNFTEALNVARQQVDNGAQIIDVNMDEAMLDSKAAMVSFLNLIAIGAGHLARAGDDRLQQMDR